jgi:hypothetical protein
VLIVVRRLQRVNESGFKATALLPILRRVGHEIQIAGAVTSRVKGVCGSASVSRPEIVTLADSQQILVAVGLHVDAWSGAKCFASFNEAWKALKCEGHEREGLTRPKISDPRDGGIRCIAWLDPFYLAEVSSQHCATS